MNERRWQMVVTRITLAACCGYGISDSLASTSPLPSARAEVRAEGGKRVPHPEPRVIVNVKSVDGPHPADAVQRAARETWAYLVRCYKKHAKRQRGQVVLELRISAIGTVRGAKKINSTFSDALSQCVAEALQRKPMPVASGSSSALVEVRLAPGDPVEE